MAIAERTAANKAEKSIDMILYAFSEQQRSKNVFKTAPPSVAPIGSKVKMPRNKLIYPKTVFPHKKHTADKT